MDKNAKMAEAMGWKVSDSTNAAGDHLGASPCKLHVVVPRFKQSHDALRTHVLPELERRGLMEAWAEKVAELVGVGLIEMASCPSDCDSPNYTGLAACLAAPASVWLDAALAVMGVE